MKTGFEIVLPLKDIVNIDGDTTFKEIFSLNRELVRSEDDEGVDSDDNLEDIENCDLSLSDDEPKVKKRIKRKGKYLKKFDCKQKQGVYPKE